MLRLCYFPTTIALAVHVALEEAGADYQLELIDFREAGQRQPAYLARNPKGRVPLLETPRGPLTETLAILAYVADTHPGAALLPTEPFARAQALGVMTFLASTLHPNHAHKLRGARWSDDPAAQAAMKRKVPLNMTQGFQLIARDHLAGPWVLDSGFSVCDAYLFAIERWAEADGVDPADIPGNVAHRAAVAARPAVQRILPLHAL